VGRFQPSTDDADRVRMVLPSGVTIVLSGTYRALDGLSATFAGGIGPVAFRVAYGRPSDFFDRLAPGPIQNAIEVAGAYARTPDFAEFGGRFAVMSSGPWTLVALLSDDEKTAAFQMNEISQWELRPTADGPVFRAPSQPTGEASVVLVDDAEDPVRRVEFTDDNCAGTSVRAEGRLENQRATGYWCENGVYVRFTGPERFVADALERLRVDVQRGRG
jgi:hypothetical protein